MSVQDLDMSSSSPPVLGRISIDPDRVEQDLARLVLTLVEFLRRLMEAQAVRRMEAETITPEEAERLGLTLLRSRDAVVSLCEKLGVAPDSLNLDLGPLGRLM
ncbi:MAG: gas vesicle protein K [Alphaproteobacteria bacterium]|jgi:hypothetical protein|nr:gas vesicle protein K [Alphaproteobacteria bacterium]